MRMSEGDAKGISALERRIPQFNLEHAIHEAERVIAPLWPITTFAARSPWYGLENQPFETVAEHLQREHGIDLYPSGEVLRQALASGEIDRALLKQRLADWLDRTDTGLPRSVAQTFCEGAMQLSPTSECRFSDPEVQRVARRLSHLAQNDHALTMARSMQLEELGHGPYGRDLNFHMAKWCKLYLDTGQATWAMPGREQGFYRAWRQLVIVDPALSRSVRRRLKAWPMDASSALSLALKLLEVADADATAYLRDSLLRLPGWAGMVRWRAANESGDANLLADYLAVRLSMEWALIAPHLPVKQGRDPSVLVLAWLTAWEAWGNTPVENWNKMTQREQSARLALVRQFDHFTVRGLYLEAWEDTYTAKLQESIVSSGRTSMIDSTDQKTQVSDPPTAQFLFCIDVRSESIRRRLEQSGRFETYGVAGFFGLPIVLQDATGLNTRPALPVIVEPKHMVRETSNRQSGSSARLAFIDALGQTFKRVKVDPLASLMLPDISGTWLGVSTLARTFLPSATGHLMNIVRGVWLNRGERRWQINPEAAVDSHPSSARVGSLQAGIPFEQQITYVLATLRSIGLTDHFAPLVVVCGHGSCSANNPYASALDCGACGGASGAANAEIFSTLCNDPTVRAGLARSGVVIPDSTVFMPAEHITTCDELHFLSESPKLSPSACAAFAAVQRTVPEVLHGAASDRLEHLPSIQLDSRRRDQRTARHAYDWSETRPEWGLARNAAFIIARREITKGLDLQGRVFLHSYDWRQDIDGQILKGILSGPGVVAQWINLQYYASTVSPHAYGSGDKTTQTVTSGIGVMQGNGSDLLAGLPLQSVMSADGVPYHAPLRLLTVIEAPLDRVRQVLFNTPDIDQKVAFGWLRLAIIDPQTGWHMWATQTH